MPVKSAIGYGIILSFGLVFYLIAHGLHKKYFVAERDMIKHYMLVGRSITYGFLSCSIFVSWTWTTTIMGAAEAGRWYGISGGLAYSLGATFVFVILIFIILRFRKIMPGAITITEFIGERYNGLVRDIFFILCIVSVLYVFIEQAVGIGIAFSKIFDIPFKISTFTIVMLVTIYVTKGGLRGVIFNDVLQFFFIIIAFGTILIVMIHSYSIESIYEGLLEIAQNPSNDNYNPNVLLVSSKAGIRYGITAIIIAMGQIFFDQGYYVKAMSAKNTKTFLIGFLLGGVFAWIPISMLSAFTFGLNSLTLDDRILKNMDTHIDVSTYIVTQNPHYSVSVLFAIMIFMAGITTGANCLVGIQTLFTIDFYKRKILKTATPKEQIKFGKVSTLLIGLLCALIAISLEGISLLKIDIFSGIFLAAPCGAFITGLYSKKTTSLQAMISIIIGIVFGLGSWIMIKNNQSDWFYGTIFSFTMPIIFLLLCGLFTKDNYNFTKLRFFNDGD